MNRELVARELMLVAKELVGTSEDLRDFAEEVAKEAGRIWSVDRVRDDEFILDARTEPPTTATVSILRRGATHIQIEAFDDDTDYEAWDETSWKAVPSDPEMRPKLVRALGKFLDRFVDNM